MPINKLNRQLCRNTLTLWICPEEGFNTSAGTWTINERESHQINKIKGKEIKEPSSKTVHEHLQQDSPSESIIIV